MPSIDDSKCILVTGATSGIGRALAIALAKLPSKPRVVAVGRRKDRLEELAKSGQSGLKNFADIIVQKYPELDTVIYNAGVQYEFYFQADVNLDKLASEINVNYISVVTLIYHFMPHFLKLSNEGRPAFIYTVTSGFAVLPAPYLVNYCASKAALHSFTISLRVQLQNTYINVTEIVPPLVESELHDDAGTTNKLSKVWMPLDQYISTTVDDLRRGDNVVTCGVSADMFKRFEEGKDEAAAQYMIWRTQM
ncbi:hypothetical protein AX14_005616 [Amanita brunnescens Koide BX004]|nr:hypothetical protein AX14_013329 [Amanita brunnescens Koide BX004]KAF8730350.1 hypothetical protein AX14_005616 [Amanita brunnescens Koide BX004]